MWWKIFGIIILVLIFLNVLFQWIYLDREPYHVRRMKYIMQSVASSGSRNQKSKSVSSANTNAPTPDIYDKLYLHLAMLLNYVSWVLETVSKSASALIHGILHDFVLPSLERVGLRGQ